MILVLILELFVFINMEEELYDICRKYEENCLHVLRASELVPIYALVAMLEYLSMQYKRELELFIELNAK